MYGEVLESGRSGGASSNSGRGGRWLVYRQEHDAAGRTRQVAAKPPAARVQLGDGGFDDHVTDGLAGLAPSKWGPGDRGRLGRASRALFRVRRDAGTLHRQPTQLPLDHFPCVAQGVERDPHRIERFLRHRRIPARSSQPRDTTLLPSDAGPTTGDQAVDRLKVLALKLLV